MLVHAPVVGPTSWAPVADELTRHGHEVVVPALTGFADHGPPYWPRLIATAAAQFPGRHDRVPGAESVAGVTLVLHSGAGMLAAQLSAALGVPATVVFADAGLPSESGDTAVVDHQFLSYLRQIARVGMVPPWPQWWPDEDLRGLFPDLRTHDAVLAECLPLPLAFFEEAVPLPSSGWTLGRSGYLLFSEAYRSQADEARRRGWPVIELPGEHLHMLVDPPAVARAIESLTADRGRS